MFLTLYVRACNHISRISKTANLLTFTDGQVVAPLWLPIADKAVDLVTADQLVPLPAPEGQRAADRYAGAAFDVEGAPARRQHGDAGQS